MKRRPAASTGDADLLLDELAERFSLPARARASLAALGAARQSEPDPPTAIRELPDILRRHLADSLVALELAEVRTAAVVADVGSGAGFPGLPLAIALPRARFELVESARRKCAVIDRLASTAGARNVRSIAMRVEELGRADGREAYDAVLLRAVGSLPLVAEYGAPLLRVGGALVAWKGARNAAEEGAGDSAAAELGLGRARVVPVTPFSGAHSRHLHVFVKSEPTPTAFPRRPGLAAKRPLA